MENNNLLKLLINSIIRIFGVLYITYFSIFIYTLILSDDRKKESMILLVESIQSISKITWDFIQPFLQLLILLVIIEWIIKKLNISFANDSRFDWNVQTVIALIVTTAFSMAALTNLSGATVLKDLALVVVGFYFGTQKKTVEYQAGDIKTTVFEEHENDVEKKPLQEENK